MAVLNIISDIPSIAFSSAFDKLEVETDLSKVLVDIQDTLHNARIYKNTLHAYEGKVTIFDLASVFEQYMEAKDYAFCIIQVAVKDAGSSVQATVSYRVLYCKHHYHGNVQEWCRRNFMLSSQARMSFAGSIENIPFWYTGGQLVREYRTVVYEAGGEQYTAESNEVLERVNETKMKNSVVNYDELLEQYNADRILSVSITQLDRTVTIFYIDTPIVAFLFRNGFNSLELATVQGVVTRKTQTEKSVASCGGKIFPYNKKDKYVFEVETAPLPYDQVAVIEQMCTSHKVWLYRGSLTPDERYRFVITDYTCETSDDDSKLQTVKFTLQFQDGRVAMREDVSEIFTTHFMPQFN